MLIDFISLYYECHRADSYRYSSLQLKNLLFVTSDHIVTVLEEMVLGIQ